jgi:hypothetical protein
MNDINRELAELFGLFWHERSDPQDGRLIVWCTCGWESGYKYDQFEELEKHCKEENPYFTSDPGKIELLRLMRKRGDWGEFWELLYQEQGFHPNFWVFYLTDTTGRLAQAALEWLTAQKEGREWHKQ